MECPNCHSNVAPRLERCPRCDWLLNDLPTATASDIPNELSSPPARWDQTPLLSDTVAPNTALIGSSVPTTTPLTGSQKFRLLFGTFLPFASLAMVIWLVLQIDFLAGISVVWLIVGVFGLIVGWQVTIHLLDFFSGVAQTQVDRLTKIQVVKFTRQPIFYGHFERVGRLNIGRVNHKVGIQGAIYQIIYSPHSKRLWMMKQVS